MESHDLKPITRYVTAAEIQSILYGFDNETWVQVILQESIAKKFDIQWLINFKTVLNVIIKNKNILEKMLQVDVRSITDCFNYGVLNSLYWIPSASINEDSLTSRLILKDHAPIKLMKGNYLDVTKIGWKKKIQVFEIWKKVNVSNIVFDQLNNMKRTIPKKICFEAHCAAGNVLHAETWHYIYIHIYVCVSEQSVLQNV